MDTYPTSLTASHVCLHEHSVSKDEASTGKIPIGTMNNPLVVAVHSSPLGLSPNTLVLIDSLALAVSALADVSAIATSATELTAVEKNQLRAILSARIRSLIPQV